MLSLRKRLDPLPAMPAVRTHTDEYPTPMPTAALPESYGPDFNLIRAVQEYGPKRVSSIRNELSKIEERKISLTDEMRTLERMISATRSESGTHASVDWPRHMADLGQEFTMD